MSLQPMNQEQVQTTAQLLLTYLDDPANSTPNNMLEGIVSAKSLMRGLVAGHLFVCQKVPDAPKPEPKAEPGPEAEQE